MISHFLNCVKQSCTAKLHVRSSRRFFGDLSMAATKPRGRHAWWREVRERAQGFFLYFMLMFFQG